jgi:hypothetical protein
MTKLSRHFKSDLDVIRWQQWKPTSPIARDWARDDARYKHIIINMS